MAGSGQIPDWVENAGLLEFCEVDKGVLHFKTPNCGKVPRDGGIKGVAFAGDTENGERSTKLLISWHLEKVPMSMCNRPFLFYRFCFSKADQLFPQGFPQVFLKVVESG